MSIILSPVIHSTFKSSNSSCDMCFTAIVPTELRFRGRAVAPSGFKFYSHPHSSFQKNSERQSSPSFTQATLRFEKYLASGNIWDFWLCHHSTYGKVVLKVVDERDPPCINPYYDEYIDSLEIIEHALQEEELLMDKLRDLQGIVVPKYYGMYQSETLGPNLDIPYLAMLLEYAGNPLGPGFIDLHEDWLNKVYEAYRAIHTRGVIHGDICTRHVLYDEYGRIRLVSFRRSDSVDMKNFMDVHRTVMEAAIVRTRFGFHEPESLDMSKEVPDYAAQLDDPDKFIDSLRKKEQTNIEVGSVSE